MKKDVIKNTVLPKCTVGTFFYFSKKMFLFTVLYGLSLKMYGSVRLKRKKYIKIHKTSDNFKIDFLTSENICHFYCINN